MDTEDNYFGDQDDLELEQIIEGRADVIDDDEDDENRERGDDEAIEAPTTKKKKDDEDEGKKKRVMAPRPKLDSVRLNSDRGLLALESEMKSVKLRGRGHELEDLDLILGRMQHWCHRLFPSYTFDDCLARLEKLGSNKSVGVQVKKIRMGMVSVDDIVDTTIRGENYVSDEEAPAPRLAPIVDPDAAFNEMLASTQPTAASTPAPAVNVLTEEQKARMLRNRLAAEERRLARLKEQEERRRAEQAAMEEMAGLEEMGM